MSRTEGGDQTRISDFVPTPMTRHLVLLGHLSPPSWSDPLPSPPVPCRKGVLGPLRRVTLSQATEQPDCLHPRFLARSLRTQKALEQRRSADPWVSPICPPHPHLHRVCQVVRSRWRTLRQTWWLGVSERRPHTRQRRRTRIVPVRCGFVFARPQPTLVAPSFSTGCPDHPRT